MHLEKEKMARELRAKLGMNKGLKGDLLVNKKPVKSVDKKEVKGIKKALDKAMKD